VFDFQTNHEIGFCNVKTNVLFSLCTNHEIGFCQVKTNVLFGLYTNHEIGFCQLKTDILFGIDTTHEIRFLSIEDRRIIWPLYQSWDWIFIKWRPMYYLAFEPIMRLDFVECLCTNHEIGFCWVPLFQSWDWGFSSEYRCGIQPWYHRWDWVFIKWRPTYYSACAKRSYRTLG